MVVSRCYYRHTQFHTRILLQGTTNEKPPRTNHLESCSHALPLDYIGFCLFRQLAVNVARSGLGHVHPRTGKSLTASCDGQILWQFHFDQDQHKPFFHPVAAPGTGVLTWNSPPDHHWHHGLWFSWKYINKVNYWEINGRTGSPDGKTRWQMDKIDTAGDGSAKIHMLLTYGPGDQTLLTEDRTISISPPAADGSYHMDWTCAFKAGRKSRPRPHSAPRRARRPGLRRLRRSFRSLGQRTERSSSGGGYGSGDVQCSVAIPWEVAFYGLRRHDQWQANGYRHLRPSSEPESSLALVRHSLERDELLQSCRHLLWPSHAGTRRSIHVAIPCDCPPRHVGPETSTEGI